jgi:hypothetical protein
MKLIIFLAALAAAAPAAAQVAPPPAPGAVAPAIDPERLALARETAKAVWPDGTYARLLNGGALEGFMSSMMDMKFGDFVPPEKLGKADADVANLTFRDMMRKEDPAFEERMRIINRVTMAELVPIFTKYEPELREGIARAYAAKFTAPELTDINRFFATPAGRAYAAESMSAMMSPEVMTRMMKAIPDFIEAMPRIGDKIQKATAHLPQPKHAAVTKVNTVHVAPAPKAKSKAR